MKLYKLLFIIFSLYLFNTCFSQDFQNVLRTNVTQNINGEEFYLHKVKKGETLSAISRAYHVNLQTILDSNFGISENIQPDEIIKIPVKSEEDNIKDNKNEGMNYRRVAKGETLYNLSQEYNITIDELKAANNGLPEGLITGEFIKIPVRKRSSEIIEEQPQPEQKQNEYFEYQAKNKISLFDLAVKYRVSIESIYKLNPGIAEELDPEQIIKIPLNTSQPDFISHTVRVRQTMNRLARKYKLDIEALKAVNPYFSRHLEKGQILRIPLPKIKIENKSADSLTISGANQPLEEIREKSEKEICHNMYSMGTYDVALLLPFYIKIYDSLKIDLQNNPEKNQESEFIKPFIFVQFYEGFLMAVDSLKKTGLNVDIHVFDLGDDINQAKILLKNPEMENMDLIIGPVYSNPFKVVADFAQKHQINIVNPLSTRDEITWGNPYVFQPQPVYDNQNQKLVEYLNTHHDFSQIFIARQNQYRDETAFAHLKNALNKDLEPRKGPFTSLYHEIIYNIDSTYSFEHLASVDYQNVVIIYSEQKLFILDLLRKLNELRDTFNIKVLGIPNWKEIEGLEPEDMNNLQTHILSRDFTNYKTDNVRIFVKKFRQQYATEPKEIAFSGYNTGIYFLSALMKFGTSFNQCIQYFNMELLNMGYDFESDGTNGFQNKNWKILGMKNYQYMDESQRLQIYDFAHPPKTYYRYMQGDY